MQQQNLESILGYGAITFFQHLAFSKNLGLPLGANHLLEYIKIKHFSGFFFFFQLFFVPRKA